MKALITGASSGIGHSLALYLSELGHDLIIVARRGEKLEELKNKVKTNVRIITLDLTTEGAVRKLYNLVKEDNVDILINNAGFGTFGNFDETNLNTELEMIDLNIKAVHILTKLFLIDFKKQNKGYILNVASIVAFYPGPLMATYYATKGYVYRLSVAIYEELRRDKSNVKISVLCPGPVATEFNDVANVNFSIKGLPSDTVAKYAIDKMFKGKLTIIPGRIMKLTSILIKIIPQKTAARIAYNVQTKKDDN